MKPAAGSRNAVLCEGRPHGQAFLAPDAWRSMLKFTGVRQIPCHPVGHDYTGLQSGTLSGQLIKNRTRDSRGEVWG